MTTTLTPTRNRSALGLYGKPVLAAPNPGPGIVRFAWSDSGAEKVEINVFNPSGERVTTLNSTAPGQTIDWTTTGIAPGIYFYRVTLTVNGSEHRLPIQKLAIV